MSRTYTPLESDVQRTIVAVAASRGVRLYRRNTGGMHWTDKSGKDRVTKFSQAGMADLWGCLPDGTHIEVEVKRKGEVPTPKQTEWLRSMATICPAIWADCPVIFGRVLDAILAGGRVVYRDGYDYDVITGE